MISMRVCDIDRNQSLAARMDPVGEIISGLNGQLVIDKYGVSFALDES
jgi:hypothetical protein